MIDMTAIVKPLGLPLRKYGLIKATLKGDLWKTTILRLTFYNNLIKKKLSYKSCGKILNICWLAWGNIEYPDFRNNPGAGLCSVCTSYYTGFCFILCLRMVQVSQKNRWHLVVSGQLAAILNSRNQPFKAISDMWDGWLKLILSVKKGL